MAALKKLTTLVIYASMVVVIVCVGTALRNVQKVNAITQQMQLAMTHDATEMPTVQKNAARVKGPPENPDGDNLGLSLDTGDTNGPWWVIVAGDANIHAPEIASARDCVSGGWRGCNAPQKWMQCSMESAATVVTFVFLLHLNNDDLITISGHIRSNCKVMNLLQAPVPDGWGGVARVLLNAVPVGASLIDSTATDSAANISSHSMNQSFSLKTGLCVFGLRVSVPPESRPAVWFQGSVSGTLAGNILFR